MKLSAETLPQATPVTGAINVEVAWSCDGTRGITVACGTYDTYAALPRVVRFEGEVYGLTGWNSDYGCAYYKRGARYATAVEAAEKK